MPGKFPKVFQKRKSSGDVLEETRPVSTFRVLERPQENVQNFETKPSLGLRRKTVDVRPMSEGNIIDSVAAQNSSGPINRGSGGTNSSSGYGNYDSSSGRYSSTSTLPSSVEGADDFAHPRSSKTMPMAPPDATPNPGFLRTAGRKFSLGGRKSLQAAEAARAQLLAQAPPPMPDHDRPLYSGIHDLHLGENLPAVPSIPTGRARAPTETSYGSESTVTMSRANVDKLEFRPSSDDDGFGDMFSGIGEEKTKPKAADTTAATNLGRPLTENKPYAPYRPTSAVPAPLTLAQSSNPASAVSPDIKSATSADGLIVASPDEERSGLFDTGMTSLHSNRSAKPQSPTSPTSPSRQNRPRRQSRRNSRGLLPRRESEHFEDTDALLVSKSVSPKNTLPPAYRDNPDNMPRGKPSPTAAVDANPNANPWADETPPPVPRHGKAPEVRVQPQSPADDGVDQTLLNDVSFQALASSADRVQTRAPSPPRKKPSGKVMTPAQFERYRREQVQRRSVGDADDSDSSKSGDEEEEEEEEDDIERNRRIAKQRQRQEAQLSVYRQSMMKITGEQPMGSSNTLRPTQDRGASRLSSKLSIGSLRERASPENPVEEEDEDEDVPLGILAAHGFPSKENNRPPNHVRSGSAAGIQYNSETYPAPPPPQSVTGAPATGPGGGNLPAFARALPKDPFYGAGLVNQPDRQSFALGGGSPGSVYGGSNHSSTNLPPPGGLVGVIASEERARAIRRGSPAKNFGYGVQDPNGTLPLPMQMQMQIPAPMPQPPPPPPPQPMAGAEQQANIQMAQQMTQMMQMQMQWMQQMMTMQSAGGGGGNMQQMQQMQQMMQQMQGMQGTPGAQGMPGMPGMPGMLGMPQQQQGFNSNNGSGRASTMLNPPNFNTGMGNQNGRAMSMMGGGSRAPSMMLGNNGMGGGPGPGYTPSIAPSERSNIGQPSRYRPVSVAPDDSDARSRSNSLGARTTLGGWGMEGNRTSTMTDRPMTSGNGLGSRSSNVISVRVVETRASARDEDDDEAGWEELRKKKEDKKSRWRMRKSHGKENVSPQPSVSSAGNRSSKNNRTPSKSATAPVPPTKQQQQPQPNHEATGLEGVFVPDLDRL